MLIELEIYADAYRVWWCVCVYGMVTSVVARMRASQNNIQSTYVRVRLYTKKAICLYHRLSERLKMWYSLEHRLLSIGRNIPIIRAIAQRFSISYELNELFICCATHFFNVFFFLNIFFFWENELINNMLSFCWQKTCKKKIYYFHILWSVLLEIGRWQE